MLGRSHPSPLTGAPRGSRRVGESRGRAWDSGPLPHRRSGRPFSHLESEPHGVPLDPHNSPTASTRREPGVFPIVKVSSLIPTVCVETLDETRGAATHRSLGGPLGPPVLAQEPLCPDRGHSVPGRAPRRPRTTQEPEAGGTWRVGEFGEEGVGREERRVPGTPWKHRRVEYTGVQCVRRRTPWRPEETI